MNTLNQKPVLASFTAILICLWISGSQAAVVDEINIPEVLPGNDYRPPLFLNGAAKRKFLMFVDVYVGSLYVENTSESADQLIHQDGFKLMEFNMLRNVRGRKIADAFYEGMRLNVTQDQAVAMEEEINQLLAMFDQRLRKGDKAIIEYRPGVGMSVNLAGNDRGIIKSKELFDAILSIWIGEFPVSQDFKAGILGVEVAKIVGESKFRRRYDEY